MNSSVSLSQPYVNCSVFYMDKNNNCSACNIKIDKDTYQKDRTTCKNCYNEKKNKNNNTLIQNQQAKNDNIHTSNNNRTLLVGPSFSCKAYLMLKSHSRTPNRDIYIITKSPLNIITVLKSKSKKKAMKENSKRLRKRYHGFR